MRLAHTFAAAAAALTLTAVHPPAQAQAPAQNAAATGTVTLYGATPTTPVWRTAYTACVGQQAFVGQEVRSFDNRPAPGCQVVLVEGVQTYELCVGRGHVPVYFQTTPIVRIEPGSSPACWASSDVAQ